MIYLPTFCKSRFLTKLQCTSLIREVSVEASAEVKKPMYKLMSTRPSWILPQLTAHRIKQIQSVTGIFTGFSYVSWIKMSIPELHILDWNLKVLPENFKIEKDEPVILALAYDVKNSLPESDVYIMESCLTKSSKYHNEGNNIHLALMLAVLLNGFEKDSTWKEKVFFQKKFVMNYLYNIVIGSERVSSRSVVENILLKSAIVTDDYSSVGKLYSKFPKIILKYEYVENFKQSELEKQENLSLALLLTLSFIEVSLFKNKRSLEKIQKRKKYTFKTFR